MEDRSNLRGYKAQSEHRPVATVSTPEAIRDELAKEGPKHTRRIKKPSLNRRWWKVALLLIALLLVIWLAYGYITTKNQLEQAKNTPNASASESATQQLIDKVGQLVDLPASETPTIATVNDASKLKNQSFFASSRNGDKVLIYSKAGKAVLYRPSTNRVIEYSTVNLASGTGQ